MYKIKNVIPVLILASLIIFFINLPTLYASFFAPQDRVFVGNTSWFDPWDMNVYVSAIKWAQKNDFYFQNSYTTQGHDSRVIYPLYTFLGILFPSQNPYLVFNIAKVVFGFFLVIVIYKLANIFLNNQKYSLVATFIISLGGGLGWMSKGRFITPDIGITPFTFLSTYERPHEILAVAFYFLSLIFFLRGLVNKKKQNIIYSALTLAVTLLFYPFQILSYFLIVIIFLFYKFRKNLSKIGFFIPQLIFTVTFTITFTLAYSSYLISGNGYEGILSQNFKTPNPVVLLFGYGVLTPIFIFQIFKFKNNKDLDNNHRVFLTIWFLTSLFLAYLPVGFAKLFLRGLFFPLVLLALIYLGSTSKRLKTKRGLVITVLLILTSLTSFRIFLMRMAFARDLQNQWSYITSNEYQAMKYLERQSNIGEGILISYPLANILPSQTYNRVYYGHGLNTPDSKQKLENLKNLYSGNYSEEEAKNFLDENNIKYVWYSNKERKIGDQFLEYNFLKSFYKNQEVEIFTF